LQYRKFGRLDWKSSALGFGAMRLPTTDNDQAHVDEAEAIKMIRYAIDHGVNYLDTAYMYHMGRSERVVAKALRDGYRAKMRLATKLPVNMITKAAEFDRIFDEQMKRTEVDKIDYYLLHGLNKDSWAKVRDLGVIAWAEQQMAKGRFGRLGFSFHDDLKAFKEIVDSYDNWVLSQVQYNFMDVKVEPGRQAGRAGVEYAASKGLAVVVMEPLRGGLLAKDPPPAVAEAWKGAPKGVSRVEMALKWLWDQPEISVVLSGMSTMQQVEENVTFAARSAVGSLKDNEREVYDRVREAYRALVPIPCTRCGYCQPCPNGVNIPDIFQLYNESMMYGDVNIGRFRYASPMGIPELQRADRCMECGECLDACPQHIPITDWLKKVHVYLTAK